MPARPGAATPVMHVSRRRLATLIGGGALSGAIWTTGLTVLARGRHPQLFVLGSDEWQVVLLEHGTNRVLMLLGEFESSPEPEIDLLCGLLRQHIDSVVGNADVLQLLSSAFRERRSVSTLIETGSSGGGAGSTRYRWLDDPNTLHVGAFKLTIEPLPVAEWRRGETVTRDWIAHATAGDVKVVFGPSIATISAHANPDSTMAVAPLGDIAALWRVLPGIAVATNTRETIDVIAPAGSIAAPRVLVRTFRRDIAAFAVRDGRLQMPDWVERAPI